MLKTGGVCRHAIAFCKKAGKNILHFIAKEDTTLYWRLRYLREFKVPTNAEYTHYSQLSFDSELEPIRTYGLSSEAREPAPRAISKLHNSGYTNTCASWEYRKASIQGCHKPNVLTLYGPCRIIRLCC